MSGNTIGTLHLWKCYAQSTDDAVYVLAHPDVDPTHQAARALGFMPHYVIARYVISLSGFEVTPGVFDLDPRTSLAQRIRT